MAVKHPLRQWRDERELTQEALAKELGVRGQTVWRWENGDRQISVAWAKKISKKTGIPAAQLLRLEAAE